MATRKSQATVQTPAGNLELEYFIEENNREWEQAFDGPYQYVCAIRSESFTINGVAYSISMTLERRREAGDTSLQGHHIWYVRSEFNRRASDSHSFHITDNARRKLYDIVRNVVTETAKTQPARLLGAEIESRKQQIGVNLSQIRRMEAEISRFQQMNAKLESEIAERENRYAAYG